MLRVVAVLLCLLPGAAFAQCAGAGGAPFNCTAGNAPTVNDLLYGGSKTGTQSGKSVRWTWGQALSAGMPGAFSTLAASGVTSLNGGVSIGGTVSGAPTWANAQTFPGLTSTGASALIGGGSFGGTWTGTQSGAGASVNWGTGAMSGASLSLTGTGTALAVTNNATVGGTLGVTGTLSIGSTINIGTTVAAGANVSIITPNGSNIVLNPQGTANVQVLAPLQANSLTFNLNNVWSGGSEQGLLVSNNTWTGSNSTTNVTALHAFLQSNVQVAATGGAGAGIYGIFESLNSNSATTVGNITGISQLIDISHATGNANGVYVSGAFNVWASANDNGTSSVPAGSIDAINPVVQLKTGATYYGGIQAAEDDCAIETGASAQDLVCHQVVMLSDHAIKGSRDDVMLSLNSQSGAAAVTYGLAFGRLGGGWSWDANSTLIWATKGFSASAPVKNIMDFSGVTSVANDDIIMPNFTVTGTGQVQAVSYTANGTAGVSCSGTPTASYAAVNGIVTHC